MLTQLGGNLSLKPLEDKKRSVEMEYDRIELS